MEKYLKLPCIKRTNSQDYSTDKEVLAAYADVPAIQAVSQLRGLHKAFGTYCEGMKAHIRKDGRIHTSYRIHRTVTGRPASADPNLSNIPRDDTAGKVLEDGKAVKNVFAASDGCCLLQADYSQIELRVLAALSGDANLREIYLNDQDAHTATAAKVFGVSEDSVTKAQRSMAKCVNFGVVYGLGLESLLEKFKAAGNTEDEGRHFYESHKHTFPGVWKFMDEQEYIIRTCKYQETPFGRRRRYAEIDNRAVRQAYNFMIQSTASEFAHIALIRINAALRQWGMRAALVLTVYDSLIFDTPFDEFWETAELVKHIMETLEYSWLTVPIKVDLEAGLTWGSLKKVRLDTRELVSAG
jgi:DNA polymerase-1